MSTSVSGEERAALLRKYRVLVAWRLRKDHEDADNEEEKAEGREDPNTDELPAATTRQALRALSHEFPGALRELDLLGVAELHRRVQVLEQHHVPVAPADEEWIAWIAAYHAWMRVALSIKGAAGRTRQLTPEQWTRALEQATALQPDAALLWKERFVRAAIRPTGGRLGVFVLDALSRHFGVSARRIAHTLFPPRRSAPYTLSS